jgi:hypothetical protein
MWQSLSLEQFLMKKKILIECVNIKEQITEQLINM